MKNIRKDTKNKVLSGVLAGIAKRYGWDANILRLIYALLTLVYLRFLGIILYLVGVMIIKNEDNSDVINKSN